jgi:hypothetical protein
MIAVTFNYCTVNSFQYLYTGNSVMSTTSPLTYTTQLGAILTREYPGLIEDKDEDGVVIGKHRALERDHYFLNTESVEASGDRVLSEFLVSNLCFASSLN